MWRLSIIICTTNFNAPRTALTHPKDDEPLVSNRHHQIIGTWGWDFTQSIASLNSKSHPISTGDGSVLKVHSLTLADAAAYKCIATNMIGTDEKLFHVSGMKKLKMLI